jgi:hypothetical protein
VKLQNSIATVASGLVGLGVIFAVAFGAGRTAQAQPYCAVYDDGEQNCGIPTLQSCEQSVSGVGGSCQPDTTSQLAPNPIDRFRAEQSGRDLAPPNQGDSSNDLNWMPPPPGE